MYFPNCALSFSSTEPDHFGHLVQPSQTAAPPLGWTGLCRCPAKKESGVRSLLQTHLCFPKRAGGNLTFPKSQGQPYRIFLRRICSSPARFLGASGSILEPSWSPHTSSPSKRSSVYQGGIKSSLLVGGCCGEKDGGKWGCVGGRNFLRKAIRKNQRKTSFVRD